MADTQENAIEAWDLFVRTYNAKYPEAADRLLEDRNSTPAFYDFPAERWQHMRTTNPIESTFTTVRLGTAKARGCFPSQTVWNTVYAGRRRENGEATGGIDDWRK